MKKRLYILLFGAALIVAMTACEPKYEYSRHSYIVMNDMAVSVAEDAGTVTLNVTAYPLDGVPNAEVTFKVNDGEGDLAAKKGVDYTIVSPANGLLVFEGDSTATITFRISDANVGVYTGRKQFTVTLIPDNITNGYELGGAYYTTVTITDTDKNPEGESIYGTYAATGYSSYTSGDTSWELTISEYPDNDELVYIEGLVSHYTSGYKAYGWLEDDDTKLIIPSQVTTDQVNASNGNTYYIGYTPCTQFSDGSFYYSSQFPDLEFDYDSSTMTWTSNYGVFFAGFSTQELSSMAVYFEAIAPVITLVKAE